MKILVRLPNWLGDLVMSIGFLQALQHVYPNALITVIAKKGIHALLEFFPGSFQTLVFSKEDHAGMRGAWRFGKRIRKTDHFDLFFCLPDSFSSAMIGYASGAGQRIGYGKELRSFLLTDTFKKRPGIHRVEQYIDLLRNFSRLEINSPQISLVRPPSEIKENVILNIHSEASSRRLPIQKAVTLIKTLLENYEGELVLIGGKGDLAFTGDVLNCLPVSERIRNVTGKTSLPELVRLMSASRMVLTTDSGPAHVANALGKPTVVLFGAGNEQNTSPFNKKDLTILRYGKLPCEPCVKNTCVLYGIPKCLELLDNGAILDAVLKNAISYE